MASESSDFAIGLDIGVTNVKAVCVTREGKTLAREMTDTRADRADWPAGIAQFVRQLRSAHGSTECIGIAAPGLASPDGTRIAWMQGRLDAVENLNWTEYLKWPRPVPVLNDAQAALLGEAWIGAAAGCKNVLLLTLGTGVGGALMVDGRLLRGHIGRAGHLGHVSLNPDAPPDITGCPGSLESAIGNCTLSQRSGGQFSSTHELIAAYLSGDADATRIWMRSVRDLAAALASLINIADPEIAIIGGGIARAGPALFEPLNAEIAKFEWRPHGHRARIVPATLGEYAGALGAARNGFGREEEKMD